MSQLKASKMILRNMKSKKEKATKVGAFVGWFLKHGSGRTVPLMEVAKFLASILPGIDITDRTVSQYIGHARDVLEARKGKSIWNVRGEGYRIASEKEKAIYLVRHTKRTLRYADRAARLYMITDKRLIPDAVQEVFGSKAKAQALLSDSNSKLFAICNQNGAHGHKRIAHGG